MYNNIIRCVLLGDSGVGKSSILDRLKGYGFNDYNGSTVGVDFGIIKNEKTNTKFHIYDTSGQCAYKSITSQYYRDATIVIFVYDLNCIESMKNIKYWEEEFEKNNLNNKLKIYIGNKSEIKKINNDELIKRIENNKNIHIEVSAKKNFNMQILKNYIINYTDNTINIDNSFIEDNCYYKINNVSVEKKNKNKCCS